MFFQLASGLGLRFLLYKQPEDVKSSVKYFRLLRTHFHSLEVSDIPHGHLTSRLVRALAENLISGSWDMIMIQDIEEMAALSHELLSSDVSTTRRDLIDAIKAFSVAVTYTFRLEDPELPPEQVIQVLQKAEMIIPDSHVSYTLAHCLTICFLKAHVINDYEEAIAIADKIVATHSSGDSLTPVQRSAIELIQVLVVSRSNSYSSPEYLEDAIHRFRTLLRLPSLPDQFRTNIAAALKDYARRRFSYFGVTNSGEIPSNTSGDFSTHFFLYTTR